MGKYTHLELNKDVLTPSGYYNPRKEVRMSYNGREVLYTVSEAVIESSCCGAADYRSAQVPGYVVGWKAESNGQGMPVSIVESITDEESRGAISRIIRDNEHVPLTEFW